MVPNLVKTTELFLVPSSFLVVVLGIADAKLLRAAVSILGLVVSALWFICTREALSEAFVQDSNLKNRSRFRILASLPIIFIAGWLFSVVIHLLLSGQALGTPGPQATRLLFTTDLS